MKYKILLMFAMFAVTFNMSAQYHPNAEINTNNIRTHLVGTGTFFDLENRENENFGYIVPASDSTKTIYQHSLWIGGIDEDGNLHLAAFRFGQTGEDYFSGPLRVTDATTDIYGVMDYHHVWKITRTDIENMIANPSGDITEDILTWPAHGNIEDGYAENLAPFVDVDGDGEYNPHNGDYPDIDGDVALFCIFNDSYFSHTETGGMPLGLEVHCMLYGFNSPGDETLNNTLFMRYWIYNRSDYPLHDVYIGYFTDFEIGYGNDDYIGCDVERGYYYGYNGTSMDGDGTSGTFGANPPAQIVAVLGGPNMPADGIDNPKFDFDGNQLCDQSINGTGFGDGIIDNERLGLTGFIPCRNSASPINSDPTTSEEYYLLLKSMWKNGMNMEYGGDGCPGNEGTVGPVCRFAFPHDSDPLNWGTNGIMPNGGYNQNGFYWNAHTDTNVYPDDFRAIGISGPFNFSKDQAHVIDLGFITVWPTWISDTEFDLNELDAPVDYIKNYFNNLDK